MALFFQDLNPVPTAHIGCLLITCSSSSRGHLTPLPPQAPVLIYICRCTDTDINDEKQKNKQTNPISREVVVHVFSPTHGVVDSVSSRLA